MKPIVFTNNKGGLSKTTTEANLLSDYRSRADERLKVTGILKPSHNQIAISVLHEEPLAPEGFIVVDFYGDGTVASQAEFPSLRRQALIKSAAERAAETPHESSPREK